MIRRSSLPCALAIVALGLATVAAADTVTVDVGDNFFDPSNVTICLGDTIDWDWGTSNNPHSSTSGDPGSGPNGVWESGVKTAPTPIFSHAFPSIPPECADDDSEGANTCSYWCTFHGSAMTGVVTIAEEPSGALSIAVSKLRVTRDGSGRGGTIKGLMTLDDMTMDDIVVNSLDVTVTLEDGFGSASDTVMTTTLRGKHQAKLDRAELQDVNVRLAKIVGREPDLAKFTVKYETNVIDVSGSLTLTLDFIFDTTLGCGGGSTVVASGTSGVAN